VSEKPKKKPSNLKKWLIGLGLLMTVVCAGFMLYIYVLMNALAALADSTIEIDFDSGFKNLHGEEAREAIETYPVNVPLPENAQDVYLYFIAWQDMSANIRFSASPESVEIWLNGNDFCFTELIPNLSLNDNVGETLDWWNPNEGQPRVASEQCGSYLETGGFQIAIDQSNPELWIVYLVLMG
jgi:hypothetical protein